jgi:beta-galactosidase/beta-glucuronidase
VLLHFQAVDHDTTVWVNGVEVVRHRGGFTPFSADLSGVASPGEETVVVVRARDTRHAVQARGKQAVWYANTDCNYTRTTGIWQTVWLEPVPDAHLRRPRITPDLAGACFHLRLPVSANRPGHRIRAVLSDGAGEIVRAETRADLDLTPRLTLPVPAQRLRPWCPEDPHLYDLRLELLDADGTVVDAAGSYAGLRSVAVDGKAVLLNGRPVFQRLVLDQGWYPDGLMTAPTDEALVRDITLAQPGSTGPACTRRSSRNASSTTPTGSATWSGASSATGAAPARARRATTSGPRPPTSPSGWKPWSATTPTPASSAGARSTRPTRCCTTASPSSTT